MYSQSITLLCTALVCSSVFAQNPTPEPTSALSLNVGVVSDYRFRSVAQTSFKPALQLGAEYAHKSGTYIGIWGSNVSWIKDYVGATDGSTEVDLYGGYKGEISHGLTFDIGMIRYQYPGNTADKVLVDANTTELYGALTYGIVTAKYSQATTNFIANTDSKGANYFELAAAFDLGNGFTLTPHVGRQSIPNQVGNAGDYTDWSITLTKDFGNGLTASAAALSTDAKDSFYKVGTVDNLGKNAVTAGLKYTF